MNVQVLTDPFGRMLWASPALPGAVHDIRAAREHGVIDALAQADVTCWADKGYRGAGGTVRTPYWGRWNTLSAGQKAVNRSHAKIRALVEQAMATLKNWRLLRKLRCSTNRITALIQAVLACNCTMLPAQRTLSWFADFLNEWAERAASCPTCRSVLGAQTR
jgi:hypothetical protein